MWILVDSVSGRLRAPWRLVAQFLFFLVVTALLTSMVQLTYSFVNPTFPAFGSAGLSSDRFVTFYLFGGLGSLAAIFISLLVVGRFLDRRPVADFGFHLNGGWFVDLGFGMFLGAFLMTGIFLVQLLIGWTSVSDTLVVVGSGNSFVLAILPPIAIFLCVGIYEEAFSRGYQLRNVAEGLNYPALGPRTAIILALVLTSAFFGLLHASNPNATAISTFNIALAGLLLGAGYVLTGELSIPIGLHITWNFFQGNVYGFPVSGLDTFGATFIDTQQAGPDLWTGGPFGPEAGLLGLLAMLTGTLLIALYTKARTGKLDLHTPLAEPPTKSSNTPETSPE